jgi:hypothetical protein
VTVGPADVVDAVDRFVGGLEDPVEELHLVHHPERTALLGRAVVREDDEHGVVELSEAFQPVDQSTDLHIGVIEECSERLLEATGEARWFSGRSAQASTPGLRGASSVPAGITPSASWRSNQR